MAASFAEKNNKKTQQWMVMLNKFIKTVTKISGKGCFERSNCINWNYMMWKWVPESNSSDIEKSLMYFQLCSDVPTLNWCPLVVSREGQVNTSLGVIAQLPWKICQYFTMSWCNSLPWTEYKSSVFSLEIIKMLHMFLMQSLWMDASSLRSSTYLKFHTDEEFSSRGHRCAIKRGIRKDASRLTVDLSKFWAIPSVFWTMLAVCWWNLREESMLTPRFTAEFLTGIGESLR